MTPLMIKILAALIMISGFDDIYSLARKKDDLLFKIIKVVKIVVSIGFIYIYLKQYQYLG